MDVDLYRLITVDFITTGTNHAVADADTTPTFEVFKVGEDSSPIVFEQGIANVGKHTGKTGHYWLNFYNFPSYGFQQDTRYAIVVSYSISGVNFKRIIETLYILSLDPRLEVLSKLDALLQGDGGDMPIQFTEMALQLILPSIWSYEQRTLTEGGSGGGASPEDIWGYTERTLTSGGDDPWATGLHGQYQVGSAGHMMQQIDSRVDDLHDRVSQIPGTGPVVVIPAPSEATQTVAYAYCYDRNGAPQEGVTLTIQIATSEPTGGGATYSRQLITAVSDENGLATVEIPRGSHLAFRARRGSGPWMQFAGVDAANVQIPYLVSHTAEIIEAP